MNPCQTEGAHSIDREEHSSEFFSDNTSMECEKVKHSLILLASKRFVDIVVSLVFFLSFGWLYVLLWLGVIISSGRPAIYSQPRLGRNGIAFKFYKFRSMVPDATAVLAKHLADSPSARQEWESFQKLEDDPRITRFGIFIRKTSLDELPQFWNVLIGDMSLVGPRPCMLNQQYLYGNLWVKYCAVRPGITGLWQVSGRNQLSYKRRVELDVEYVQTLSFFGDMHIFLRTIWVVIVGHGAK